MKTPILPKLNQLRCLADIQAPDAPLGSVILRTADGVNPWITVQTHPDVHCYAIHNDKRIPLPDGCSLHAYTD